MDWTVQGNMVKVLFLCATPQAAEGVIFHLCKQERRLKRTHSVLDRTILGGWVSMSGMNLRSLVVLCNHSAFHR